MTSIVNQIQTSIISEALLT
jgi:hypothetical protein